MAGSIGRMNPSIANLDRLLDQMVEILHRKFEPLDFRQRARDVNPVL